MAQVLIEQAELRGGNVVVTGVVDGRRYQVTIARATLDAQPTRAAKRAHVAAQLAAVSAADADRTGVPIDLGGGDTITV